MRRENKKVKKDNLIEVTGNREQLKRYKGETVKAEVFMTNTLGYQEKKRLAQQVKIGDLYISHCWFRTENVGKLPHGYQKIKVKIIEYQDQETKEIKYGLKYQGEKGKMYQNNELIKPKWMN